MGKKKASSAQQAPRQLAPRFGIGEWYGRSFVHLSDDERRELAEYALVHKAATAPPCYFMAADGSKACSKKGGVCSLRLYEPTTEDPEIATAVDGDAGSLRVVCPHRFKQDNIIYNEIGDRVLGDSTPIVTNEVRFLQRPTGDAEQSQDSEDVGNIDNVLVHRDTTLLEWCALEIQAVYFSGTGMGELFKHIRDFAKSGIPFPDAVRRPDYRSSGPKRLMPQLQIKVPTLRRWGRKMAVVVDRAWFETNLIDVDEVDHISNCDVAWFVVEFDESTNPATVFVGEPRKQTLERAVESLTGGYPVTLPDFEAKLLEKVKVIIAAGSVTEDAADAD